MDTDLTNEQWAEIKFDFEFTNQFRIEVSNFGRIRSFTKLGNGRLLKGSVINGYRIIRLKLFKPRDEKSEAFLAHHKSQISKMNSRQAKIKRKLAGNKLAPELKTTLLQELNSLKILISDFKKRYNKLFKEDVLKRTVNYAQLVHRLVAENFIQQPTSDHGIVIHLDFNKSNNHYSNLKWVTLTESIAHQQHSPFVVQEKLRRKGKRATYSKAFKLSESNVMLIKKKIIQGVPIKSLIKQFKVTQTQLLRIKRGENWGDVQPAF